MSADDYLDDDEPRLAPRSIFSTGWFRALLVLGILGVILVFAVPYVLEWLEPPAPRRQAAQPEAPKASPPAQKAAPVTPPAPTAAPPAPKAAPAPPPTKLGEATTPKGDLVQPAPSRTDRPLLGPGGKTAPPEKAPPAEKPAPPAKTAQAEKAPPAEKAMPPAKAQAPEKALPAEKAAPPEKAAPAEKAPTKTERLARAEPSAPEKPKAATPKREPAAKPAPAPGGDFWVQVGAFQDEKNAERLAATLREGGQLTVEVVRVTRGAGAGDQAAQAQHQVFVSGSTVETVSTALRGSGKSAQAAAGGVAVQPPMSMREAVDLSQKLRAEGLNVSIRRVGGGGDGGGAAFFVVRTGGYPTRAAAAEAKRTLEGRGIGGFVARGPAR